MCREVTLRPQDDKRNIKYLPIYEFSIYLISWRINFSKKESALNDLTKLFRAQNFLRKTKIFFKKLLTNTLKCDIIYYRKEGKTVAKKKPKKKSGAKIIEKIVIATAILNLLTALIELIEKLGK